MPFARRSPTRAPLPAGRLGARLVRPARTQPGLVFVSRFTGGAATDGPYTTASWTPNLGAVYFLTVNGRTTTGSQPPQPSVSGNGLTWTFVGAADYDTTGTTDRQSVFVFAGTPGTPAAGATTITFTGVVLAKADWAIDEVFGANTTTPVVAANVVSAVTATTANSLAGTLSTFTDATNNGAFAGYGHQVAETMTPNTLAILSDEFTAAASLISTQTGYRVGQQTDVGMSWVTAARAGLVAFEVRSAVATGGATATPSAVLGAAAVAAPSITVGTVATPGALAGQASIGAAVVAAGAVAAPGAIAGTASIAVAAVIAGATPTPGTVAATAAIPAPGVAAGAVIGATVVAGAASIPAPTVSTALIRLNTFNGGSDGATITTANSGGTSGDAFDVVTNAPVFATAAARHGSLGMRAALSGTTQADVRWSTSFGSQSSFATRDYFKIDATPTAVTRLFETYNTAGTVPLWGVGVNTAGKLVVRNIGTGTTAPGGLSSATITLNTWHRYEITSATWNGTDWSIVVALFLGTNVEGTSADETLTTTGGLTLGAVGHYCFGAHAPSAITFTADHDSIGVTNGAPFGPAGGGISPAAVVGTALIPTPTVATGSTVVAAAVTGLAAIPTPTVSTAQNATATPAVVTALATIGAPVVAGAAQVVAGVVAGSTTIPAATFASTATVTASVVNATTTVAGPVVAAGARVTPTAVAGTTTVAVPVLATSSTATPTVVSGAAGIPTPAVAAGGSATAVPATVTATSSVGGPVISAGSRVVPSVVAAAASVGAPTLVTGATVPTVVVTAVVTIPAPGVRTGALISVTAVTGISTIPTPAVVVGGGATATPSVVALTTTVAVPSVRLGVAIAPTAVAAVAAILGPALRTGAVATPAAVLAQAVVIVPKIAEQRVTVGVLVVIGQPTTTATTAVGATLNVTGQPVLVATG